MAPMAVFTALNNNNPGIVVPPPPEKQQLGRFQEEFVEFLKRHGLEYDERYLWD